MRIGIDARFAVRDPIRGIGTYSVNLIRALAATRSDDHFVLYVDKPDSQGRLPRQQNVEVKVLGPSFYPVWEQVSLPRAERNDRLDVLHTLGNTGPVGSPGASARVLSVMDVMFLQSGDLIPKPRTTYQRLGRAYRAQVVPPAMRSADLILTISEFSRADILKTVAGTAPDKVQVTHLACDPAYAMPPPVEAVSERSDTPSAPIVCLGAVDPRKNTRRIVDAYLDARRRGGIANPLHVVGYSGWEQSDAYRAVLEAGAADHVTFKGFVSVAELRQLYATAHMFVYASLYEGFGIPLLEAFHAGCPVIASNTTSIPEIAGDAANLVDPTDTLAIADSMLALHASKKRREQLGVLGKRRAQQFSWERTAQATWDAYGAALARAKRRRR